MRNELKKYLILLVFSLMACSSFAEKKAVLVACKDLGSISDEPIAMLLDQKGYAVTICKQNDLTSLQLENFDAAVISANADADNEAILNLIRGGQIPVLNMQGFTYAQGRLNWGKPHSCTLESSDNKCFDIYVEHPEHPIFKGFDNLEAGSRISILDDMEERGLMPIQVDLPGTWCLATAYTQSIEDFYGVGEPQTSIHEIPAEMRGGNKYICLPIAMSGAYYLSDEGKKLILNIMSYLMSDEKVDIDLPFLEISAFSIEGFDAQINQAENTIELAMDAEEFSALRDRLRASGLPCPAFNLLSGGMLLGACFMATDYVTSPMSNLGGIIFGIGIGLLTVIIRYFGAYPEGMSFAILIMNATVPLLNRWFHQKKFGRA